MISKSMTGEGRDSMALDNVIWSTASELNFPTQFEEKRVGVSKLYHQYIKKVCPTYLLKTVDHVVHEQRLYATLSGSVNRLCPLTLTPSNKIYVRVEAYQCWDSIWKGGMNSVEKYTMLGLSSQGLSVTNVKTAEQLSSCTPVPSQRRKMSYWRLRHWPTFEWAQGTATGKAARP